MRTSACWLLHIIMPPRSMQARSVGNSAKLKATALVEAFNLRAAIELAMGSPAGGWGRLCSRDEQMGKQASKRNALF